MQEILFEIRCSLNSVYSVIQIRIITFSLLLRTETIHHSEKLNNLIRQNYIFIHKTVINIYHNIYSYEFL